MFGSSAEPCDSFGAILGDSVAALVLVSEYDLGFDMALRGSPAVPLGRYGGGLGDSVAVPVFASKCNLGVGVSFWIPEDGGSGTGLGGPPQPFERFGVVLGDSVAALVFLSEHELGFDKALFGGLEVPLEGLEVVFGEVLGDSIAVLVIKSKDSLGAGVSLFGDPVVPLEGLAIVFGEIVRPETVCVGKDQLGVEVSGFGGLSDFLDVTVLSKSRLNSSQGGQDKENKP